MTVGRLQTQVQTLMAKGKQLSSDDVKSLMGMARDQKGIDSKELNYLKNLPNDAFAPGAREDLAKLLGGAEAPAYVNITSAAQPTVAVGSAAKTGVSGVTMRAEDGLGQLTQNVFWLDGKAKDVGKLSINLDGKTVSVTARKGESVGSLAQRLAKALPAPYQANVNAQFAGQDTCQVQIFRMETMPPELVKPVLDGKAPKVKVLITGYGKFASYKTDAENPAWQLAQKVAKQAFQGAEVIPVLLPVRAPPIPLIKPL